DTQKEKREQGEESPKLASASPAWGGLVGEDALRCRRAARKAKSGPDIASGHVLAERPGGLSGGLFHREQARRMNVVVGTGLFANGDLPGKLAKHEVSSGVGGLKVAVNLTEVICDQRNTDPCVDDGLLFANGDVVPVALVFGEVAESLVRIEEDVFVPKVADTVNHGASALKADNFVIGAAKFAAGTERDQRAISGDGFAEGLQDFELRSLGVEDAVATFADDRCGLAECAKGDGGAALRAIQSLSGGLLRRAERWGRGAHHQPSN